MPNLKASIKSLRQSKRNKVFNDRIKRRYKNALKDFNLVVESDPKSAAKSVPELYKMIDKAAQKGVIKPTTASRKKSRLAKKLNTKTAPNVEPAKESA